MYSGAGISALRDYLNAQLRSNNAAGSDYETSTRRGSSSSTSSIVPVTGAGTGAGNTPPPVTHGQRSSAAAYPLPIPPTDAELAAAYAYYHGHVREDNHQHGVQGGTQAQGQSSWQTSAGQRRISEPNAMSHDSGAHSVPLPRGMLPSPVVPDPLPAAFASVVPNFLRPSGIAGPSNRIERSGSRPPITSMTRPSRASSASSSAALSAGEDSPRPWLPAQQQQQQHQMRHRHAASAPIDRAMPDSNTGTFLPRMARSDSPMQIDGIPEPPVAQQQQQHRYLQGSPFTTAVPGRLPGALHQAAGASTAVERIEFPVPVPAATGARHRGYSGSHAMSGPVEPYVFTSGRRASAVPMSSSSSSGSGIHHHQHHHQLHHRPHFQSSHAMLAASAFPLLPSQGFEGGGGYNAPLGTSAPGGASGSGLAFASSSSSSGRHSPAALGGLPLGQQYPYTNVESQVPYHSPTDYVRHNGTGTRPRRSGSASEAISHLVTTVGSTAVSAATAVAGGVAAAAGVGAAGVVGGGGRARGESVSSRLRWVADMVGWGMEEDSHPATGDSAQQQQQQEQRGQEGGRSHEQEHLLGGNR